MSIVTLPNLLSLSRIALIPVLAAAVINNLAMLSMGIFGLVVVSDVLDGIFARRSNQASPTGALLDHASDAVFVITMTGLCAYLDLLPPLLPVVIAIAFIQYSVDSKMLGKRGLRPSQIGRWNGIAYFVITGLAIAVHLYVNDPIIHSTLRSLAWVLIASTGVSITERTVYFIRANRSP